MRWDIFCKVIDNYGDIGVCWRLASNLAHDHRQQVCLWVDDLASFARLCPALNIQKTQQYVEHIEIRHWGEPFNLPDAALEHCAEVVIEAFACELPEAYRQAMLAQRKATEQAPLWLNLEYLSAEAWVESCHGLPSPQTGGLQKTFFFPGFTAQTGGLLREPWLATQRTQFLAQGADWRSVYGLPTAQKKDALHLSLFSYENAALPALLKAWQDSAHAVHVYVPQGKAWAQLKMLYGLNDDAPRHTQGALTLEALPFVSQNQYDHLLWACDLNFVRGEDSLCRALWAQRPLVWQLYPQSEDSHLDKLNAFLERYQPPPATQALWQAWNRQDPDTARWQTLWADYLAHFSTTQQHATAYAQALSEQIDLGQQLMTWAQQQQSYA